MSGWSGAARGANWRVRCGGSSGLAGPSGRWTPLDVAATVVAFLVHWEFGLAFLALKLWQQASGYQGSAFSFASEKWQTLVAGTRSILSGSGFSAPSRFGSSGNKAFDDWRGAELARIDAERAKLRTAEQDFAAYRDELVRAKDREDFDRFMQARDR